MIRPPRHFVKSKLPLLALGCIPLLVGGNLTAQSVPGIAEREIARRVARIEDAKKSIERGDKLFADGEYESSLGEYRSAKGVFDTLPNAPFIADWRELANLKFADCAVVVAKVKAKEGNYPAARELLSEAQLAVPEHRESKVFARHLDDPDRWPPALTPEHVQNVVKVKDGLLLANSSLEIGNYDKAREQYQDVLRIDPYNMAARRGMEKAEQKRSEYFDTARDHQRIRMLNMVNESWEDKAPVKDLVVNTDYNSGRAPTQYLTRKMQDIVFPQVAFSGASVEEAIEFLRVKSRDLDVKETDPSKKGVNIIIKQGESPSGASISLDLKDVPMVEALRYVTELAGMKYKVEPYAVLVVPLSETTNEQYTRVYRVPPDFLSLGGGDTTAAAAPAAGADPFAAGNGAAPGGSTLIQRKTALEILKSQGIPFPEGASAVFNPVTSQLIIRNTQPNLDLAETFVDSIINQGPKLVYITSKFVEVSQKNTDELGFDWLLGNLGVGANSFIGGGSVGNSGAGALLAADFPQGINGSPISRGLRSGTNAITGNAIDALINGAATVSSQAPGVLSFGILSGNELSVVVRALAQKKGVDLMSAPSITTKSGQRATVSVVREFIYPTEFDPPQVPSGGVAGSSAGVVTPTTPTAFEPRNTGVTMEVDPTVGADGYTIDLNLSPEVVEFDGFINYGTPIFGPNGATGAFAAQILLTDNVINQPVFSVRKVQTAVTVWDGQTVALGGLIREDVQNVEDKIPVIGDLPFVGRLFQSKSEDHFKRNLMIFVTAQLIDPSGQKVRRAATGGAAGGAGGPTSDLLPPVSN